jgi:hypothetical protein
MVVIDEVAAARQLDGRMRDRSLTPCVNDKDVA